MTPEHRPGRPSRLLPGPARVVLAALLAGVVLLAGVRPARSDGDPKEIARLIEQLGDDDLATRKEAEKKLNEIGEPALAPLRQAAKKHADADVRLRAVVLVRAIEKGAFGEMRKFTGHTGAVRHLAVSRDGKRALSGSMDNTVRLWEIDTGKELKKMTGHTSWAWQVAFSPDDKNGLSSGSLDKTLRLWNLADGKELRKFDSPTVARKTDPAEYGVPRVYGAAVSPDGRYVVSGEAGAAGLLRLWEAETGKEVRKLEGHTGWVWKVQFFPDGKKIASVGSSDYSFRVWDAETGKALVVGEKAHDGFVVGLAISPDGKRLLTSGRDGRVKLWDAETGKLARTYEDGTRRDNIECVAFSKDGKRFLAGGDGLVRLYDVGTGKVLHRFEGHTTVARAPAGGAETETKHYVFAVAFVDERRALSAGDDNVVRLWGLPK
jgi:WD40 repeat protein